MDKSEVFEWRGFVDFHDLDVWKAGMEITKDIYKVTEKFPKSELFGLTSQMRRAAVSIPSNIAEGNGRYYRKEYLQFLHISQGSLLELMTQIELSKELGFLQQNDFFRLYNKAVSLNKMLKSLIRGLRKTRVERDEDGEKRDEGGKKRG